jgi:hypothetical protein
MLVAIGMSSCSISSCFGPSFASKLVTPIMLPPGWARLATNPVSTGSAPLWKTTGIVVVADFAAIAAGIPGPATITLT